MDTNIFEQASRRKLRFQFRGVIGVEQLWDLRTEDLNVIFQGLKAQAKMFEEESLLKTPSKRDAEVLLGIEIVKHIFNVKVEEEERVVKAIEKRQKKAELLELRSEKEKEANKSKSIEEIDSMIEALDAE